MYKKGMRKNLYDEQFKKVKIDVGNIIDYLNKRFVILGFLDIDEINYNIVLIEEIKFETAITKEDIKIWRKDILLIDNYDIVGNIDKERISKYIIKLKLLNIFVKDIKTKEYMYKTNRSIKVRKTSIFNLTDFLFIFIISLCFGLLLHYSLELNLVLSIIGSLMSLVFFIFCSITTKVGD